MGNLSQLLIQLPYLLIDRPQQVHILFNNPGSIPAQLLNPVGYGMSPKPCLAQYFYVPLRIHSMQLVDHPGPGPYQPPPMA